MGKRNRHGNGHRGGGDQGGRGGGGGGDNGGRGGGGGLNGGRQNGGFQKGGGRGGGRGDFQGRNQNQGEKFCNNCGPNKSHNTNDCRKKGGNQQQGSNQNQGDKFCDNCGTNKSHNTNDCRKKGGNQKNSPHTNGGTDRKPNNNANNTKGFDHLLPCPRCGLSGHTRQHCSATEVPISQRCACGCEFHRPNQCPWDHDPLERGAYEAPGMICQWCKDIGDGLHTDNDCAEMKSFRAALLLNIQRSYDMLKWCWHCSSTKHLTRVCQTNAADQGKVKWTSAVSSVATAWLQQDLSISSQWYRSRDNDMTMLDAIQKQRPPNPADYKWCIICENFGHVVLNDSMACNQAEYQRRCPTEFHNASFETPQSFIPTANRYFTRAVRAANPIFNEPRPPHVAKTYSICENTSCGAFVGPWEYPIPDFGHKKPCPACQILNQHPAEDWVRYHRANGHRIEELDDDDFGKITEYDAWAVSQYVTPKRKRSLRDVGGHPCRKRPSVKLPLQLAITKKEGWPMRQPHYTDLSLKLDLPELFKDNGSVFNQWGNFQTYFPAAMILIDNDMRKVAKDTTLPINRAGYLGQRAKCANCKQPIAVIDDEGDVVMCGNNGWCGLGCGLGTMFWYEPALGQIRPSCKCMAILGQHPQVEWITIL